METIDYKCFKCKEWYNTSLVDWKIRGEIVAAFVPTFQVSVNGRDLKGNAVYTCDHRAETPSVWVDGVEPTEAKCELCGLPPSMHPKNFSWQSKLKGYQHLQVTKDFKPFVSDDDRWAPDYTAELTMDDAYWINTLKTLQHKK